MSDKQPQVAIIMGSDSDWPVMKLAAQMLEDFGVSYEAKVVSAHRTPDLMFEFAESAAAKGFQVIIAGAGGAAHLPGMVASKTTLPVLGVPVPSKHLQGQDSLYSIVQMPGTSTQSPAAAGAQRGSEWHDVLAAHAYRPTGWTSTAIAWLCSASWPPASPIRTPGSAAAGGLSPGHV